ncbi:MAG TPA: O-linked GlcNAc transferase [Planctomycetaceae bacterium]|nr:O-linked GlcNAc transferase [Planctomycetaceae bacterium]
MTEAPPPFQGKRVAFVGKLGGVNRRQAHSLIVDEGGFVLNQDDLEDANVDIVIIGAEQWPPTSPEELLPNSVLSAVKEEHCEIITETQFWERLGLLTEDQAVRRLYTPAMLAELLEISVAVIRRWHRRGLIIPVREIHRLPYFDFQEVATARHLAELLEAGASPAEIERRLEELARYVPDVDRPLAQLSVIVEGRHILLRQGEGLVEPGGQLRMDFESLEANAQEQQVIEVTREDVVRVFDRHDAEAAEPKILPFDNLVDRAVLPQNQEEILAQASEHEEAGELEVAIELYRSFLAAYGLRAQVCFQLAELLYRTNDYTAARERYYMAIELDENYVEARANLGCVLIDTGELDLAIAALLGALKYHPDYPDAHYHLARTLDELGRHEEAVDHWRAFLVLAPDSPWAQQARDRLR